MTALHATLHALAAALQQRGWMLACAESCTGGLLAAALTDLPGSSRWFERGFVTYSNASKRELLGVCPDTLAQHGAVSEQTAAQMARGVLTACPAAHLSLSTTGIAGPGGGTPDKPVGTVCFGFAWRNGRNGGDNDGDNTLHVQTQTQHFSGTRQHIRQASVTHALQQALRVLAEQGR